MKMLKAMPILAAGLLVAVFTGCSTSHPSNEVTMSGTVVCAKCKLHVASSCQNVLQVQQGGQTVNYFLVQNDVSKGFHDQICTTGGEKATVTGTVSEKNGKEIMTASKIEPVK